MHTVFTVFIRIVLDRRWRGRKEVDRNKVLVAGRNLSFSFLLVKLQVCSEIDASNAVLVHL